MAFEVGQIAGNYQILGVLGKGGMGCVYRVRNVISDRIEAMKLILEDVQAESTLGERFIAEIRTLARFDHQNIAKLHTACKIDNQLVMLMEFVEGSTLAEKATEGPTPVNKLVDYISQVLSALGYAHQNGVVHRDIKPSNIMITPQGRVKLMDFGIAKSSAEPLLTRPGTTIGSMLYMSPEQVRGTPVDARSDLYSVGMVLYELATGRVPFQAESTYAVLEAQLNTPPKPPVEINPSLPKALNDVILTALEKDPANRFQSAAAFRKALESVAAVETAERTRHDSDTRVEAVAPAFASTATAPKAAPFQSPTVVTPAAPPSQARTVVTPAAGPFQSPTVVTPAGPFQSSTVVTPVGGLPRSKGNRAGWMVAGAIPCVCVLAAALVALPHFRKSSANTLPGGGTTGGGAAVPGSVITGTATASTDKTSQPVLTTDAAKPNAASDLNVSGRESAASGIAGAPADSARAGRDAGRDAAPVRHHPRAEQQQDRQQQQREQQQQQQAATTPPPKPNGNTASTPAPPFGPSAEALNNASEALMKLNARADAVRGSLNQLRQQQAQSGYGLRQDIAASASRLDSYLQMADRMIQSGNLALAQKNMDHAEEELDKLEKFFGR